MITIDYLFRNNSKVNCGLVFRTKKQARLWAKWAMYENGAKDYNLRELGK